MPPFNRRCCCCTPFTDSFASSTLGSCTLTTRTSDTAGLITCSLPHTIINGMTAVVSWTFGGSGSQTVTIDAITDTTITFSGGVGDALPSQGNTTMTVTGYDLIDLDDFDANWVMESGTAVHDSESGVLGHHAETSSDNGLFIRSDSASGEQSVSGVLQGQCGDEMILVLGFQDADNYKYAKVTFGKDEGVSAGAILDHDDLWGCIKQTFFVKYNGVGFNYLHAVNDPDENVGDDGTFDETVTMTSDHDDATFFGDGTVVLSAGGGATQNGDWSGAQNGFIGTLGPDPVLTLTFDDGDVSGVCLGLSYHNPSDLQDIELRFYNSANTLLETFTLDDPDEVEGQGINGYEERGWQRSTADIAYVEVDIGATSAALCIGHLSLTRCLGAGTLEIYEVAGGTHTRIAGPQDIDTTQPVLNGPCRATVCFGWKESDGKYYANDGTEEISSAVKDAPSGRHGWGTRSIDSTVEIDNYEFACEPCESP